MLRILRQGQKWIVGVVVVGVGLVFALYLGIGGQFQPAAAAGVLVQVGGRSYGPRDLDRLHRQFEQQMREQDPNFDPDAARMQLLRQAAAELVRISLLAGEAESLGLDASEVEVREFVRSLPGALDDEGRISRDIITNFAQQSYGTLQRFEEAVRDQILALKLQRLILGAVGVSDAEARARLRYRQETASVALVRFDGTQVAADLEAPEEAVEALLAEEPERLRAAYETRSAEFDRPEQVRARHILAQLDPEADEAAREAARERLSGLRERLLAGADFAELAREESDDPGSKEQGGDLGFFARGVMAERFEEAAFGLEPGVVSELVETPFGLHILRVEERQEALLVPFEEARRGLAEELARERESMAQAQRQAGELAAAIAAGESLVEAARQRDLPILRPAPLSRSPGGYINELGQAAPDVVLAAFALEGETPSGTEVHEIAEGVFVLVQRLSLASPAPEALEAELAAEREALLASRRREFELQWLSAREARLDAAGDLRVDLSEYEN